MWRKSKFPAPPWWVTLLHTFPRSDQSDDTGTVFSPLLGFQPELFVVSPYKRRTGILHFRQEFLWNFRRVCDHFCLRFLFSDLKKMRTLWILAFCCLVVMVVDAKKVSCELWVMRDFKSLSLPYVNVKGSCWDCIHILTDVGLSGSRNIRFRFILVSVKQRKLEKAAYRKMAIWPFPRHLSPHRPHTDYWLRISLLLQRKFAVLCSVENTFWSSLVLLPFVWQW